MTNPTPTTTPTPQEGLTDERLLQLMPEQFRADLATASRLAAQDAGPDTKPGVFRVILNTGALAYARAAIAADRAQRAQTERAVDPINLVTAGIRFGYMAGHNDTVEACYGDPDSVAEDYAAEILSDVRPTPAPAPTPEEIETQFRAWWAKSYPNAPAGPHAVASHVAFALHLLGRGVQ